MADPRTSERRRDLLALAALALVLLLPALGSRAVWNPDEARYAEVAREMRISGEWFLPHLNGEVYAQKPPLLFWSMNLASLVTGGLNEWAARLPSALAALATILLTYRIGRRFFGRRAGLLAAVVLATSFKVLWQGRFGQIDMLLTALVAAGVWFWVRAYTEEEPRLYLLFFAFAGLATLAKGPVGLLPPLLSAIAFVLVTRERGELRRMHIGLGLLVWAAVVLAWLVPAGFAGGEEYLRTIVFKQNVTRYADPWHHFQPPWYYLTVIPADFFPWALLLPGAIFAGWRRLRGDREVSEGGVPRATPRAGYLFALCWMIVTVAFFSISSAKRTVYILTMYPAMALLVGSVLDRLALKSGAWAETRTSERRWLVWPLAAIAVVALLGAVAAPFAAKENAEDLAVIGPGLLPVVVTALALQLAGAATAWWLARRGRLPAATGALALGMAGLALALFVFAVPRFDTVKSARPLSKLLVERMAPGEPYAIYPRLDAPFLFYTERFSEPLDDEAELRAYAARQGRKWLLIERDDLADIAKLGEPLPLVEVARDHDLHDGYVLMTDRPIPAPGR